MNDTPLARFEARIAGLVEGAFAQIFGNPGSAHAALLRLYAALDAADAQSDPPSGRFVIAMQHAELEAMQHAWPAADEQFARHLAEQRALRGRPTPPPEIVWQADEGVPSGTVIISSVQAKAKGASTGALPRVPVPAQRAPEEAILVSDTGRAFALNIPILTIGRAPDCDIVLTDPYSSRQHAQLRLRGERYVLLDAGSQSGTFVNGAAVHEHTLHAGDVIRIGRSVFVYQDQQADDAQATQPMPPRMD